MSAFNWNPAQNGPGLWIAHLGQFHMQAWIDGRWLVAVVVFPKHRVIVSSEMQTTGTDLQDAQRRAQAAAMILHTT